MATDHDHDHGRGDCDEAIASLYQYIDGEITDTTRSVVQQHLDDCSPCFEAYDFEAELRIVISKKCREEVPDTLKERIRSLIDPPVQPPGP